MVLSVCIGVLLFAAFMPGEQADYFLVRMAAGIVGGVTIGLCIAVLANDKDSPT